MLKLKKAGRPSILRSLWPSTENNEPQVHAELLDGRLAKRENVHVRATFYTLLGSCLLPPASAEDSILAITWLWLFLKQTSWRLEIKVIPALRRVQHLTQNTPRLIRFVATLLYLKIPWKRAESQLGAFYATLGLPTLDTLGINGRKP